MWQSHPARKPGAAQAFALEQAFEDLLYRGFLAVCREQARGLLEDALLARRRIGDADVTEFKDAWR